MLKIIENFIRLYYVNSTKTVHGSVEFLKKDFSWRGKRPKIKNSSLIGDYEKAVYKDVDIKVKIMAWKIILINKS